MIKPTQTPITGNEEQGDLSYPLQALVQLYHAFNFGNLEEMSQNWGSFRLTPCSLVQTTVA